MQGLGRQPSFGEQQDKIKLKVWNESSDNEEIFEEAKEVRKNLQHQISFEPQYVVDDIDESRKSNESMQKLEIKNINAQIVSPMEEQKKDDVVMIDAEQEADEFLRGLGSTKQVVGQDSQFSFGEMTQVENSNLVKERQQN